MKQILVDGGYITFNGSTPTYHYYLQDHLGNNRVVCNASGTVEQVNHYYPFGGLFGQSTNGDAQRYKYNSKEFDRMHGLDWYDYGTRHMDGMRFTTMDPMAEKYYNMSPYAYCGNNPINAIDINGDSIFYDLPIIERGKIVDKVRYTYGKYGETYGFGRNGDLYQGDNTTIGHMTNALNRIRNGGEVGRGLVDFLQGRTGTNVVLAYSFNETTFNTDNITVNWDLIGTTGGVDINGNVERPAYIGLAHELAHAYDMLSNGHVDESVWFYTTSGNPIKMLEKNACIIENKIRLENSLPQRAFYDSIGGIGFLPSQLPIFYHNNFINRQR